jgi:signal transduction histidine kinase/DNA-binding response OmpR family regulator
MKAPFLNKADLWLTKKLSDPGIDKDSLAQRKIYWISSVAVTTMILLLVVVYHIVFPDLRIIIYYGLFLAFVYVQGILFPLFGIQVSVTWQLVNQIVVAVATFITMIMMGGIPTSGGLILVGLALVFFTLNYREKRHSIIIYVVYVVTVILTGILHPYLTVPAEMTTQVNISLFVVNILWITGFAMVFVLNFISQRIKLEEIELNRVRELDDAKTHLYTNITHEFRTPLTVITGMNDLMRSDPDKWLAEGTETVDRNAKILLNLVNQMLDLARLDAGVLPVRMIRSDINQYIRYIVELFRSVATASKISLYYNPCEQPSVIDYDPEKLLQVISNLISNSLKFTQPLGRIEIATRMASEESFQVIVTDSGMGIPEDFLPHVFDRFSRGETGTVQSRPGSGLGLALTKELVTLLGGTITVESYYGHGTEFTVTLPVTRDAQIQSGPDLHELKSRLSHYIWNDRRKSPETDLAGHRGMGKPLLLIVEDNDDVVRYLMTLFDIDYDIIVAMNGEEGLDKAIEFVPDIILSDIMMPVMDGIVMLDRIKNDLRTSHIPVVMLTARADIASRLEGLARGADAYMSKPFNREELKVQLKSLIGLRRKLQDRYSSVGNLDLREDSNFEFEDQFMHKVREIMTANISNESLDIQQLCDSLNMSRTQLYRKFRSLTNRTVTHYLRSLRLSRAMELLSARNVSVAEAAFRTGFRNVSHFSRVFTGEFGVNPSDIIR